MLVLVFHVLVAMVRMRSRMADRMAVARIMSNSFGWGFCGLLTTAGCGQAATENAATDAARSLEVGAILFKRFGEMGATRRVRVMAVLIMGMLVALCACD
jgi:hypothetical protein